MTATTDDSFLDGRLVLRQPAHGYRAGADPVFLASAVEAKPGQTVLDLGCGVGAALFCLMHRVSDLLATGVEYQSELAGLARLNASQNDFEATIHQADLAELPREVRNATYDHVLTNPPFFDRRAGSMSNSPTREAGRGEGMSLGIWIDIATKRLAPKGQLTLIQRADRLGDVLTSMDGRLGDVTIQPLAPRVGKAAELVIVSARKSARGALTLLPPLILHDGTHHNRDGDSYSAPAKAILRDGLGFREVLLASR